MQLKFLSVLPYTKLLKLSVISIATENIISCLLIHLRSHNLCSFLYQQHVAFVPCLFVSTFTFIGARERNIKLN